MTNAENITKEPQTITRRDLINSVIFASAGLLAGGISVNAYDKGRIKQAIGGRVIAEGNAQTALNNANGLQTQISGLTKARDDVTGELKIVKQNYDTLSQEKATLQDQLKTANETTAKTRTELEAANKKAAADLEATNKAKEQAVAAKQIEIEQAQFPFSADDRKILAQIGDLHTQTEWIQLFDQKGNEGYKKNGYWTGFAYKIAKTTLGKTTETYYGLFGDGTFQPMPLTYTPEKNPVTAKAWAGAKFPADYFGGVQPLNALEKLPDGRDSVVRSAYRPEIFENTAPYDLETWGNTYAFIQGTNVRMGKNFNSNGSAYVLAIPNTNLHLWIVEGEVDIVNPPKDISNETAYFVARTWFAGLIASQDTNKMRQHGNFEPVQQIEIGNLKSEVFVPQMAKITVLRSK